MTSLRPAFTHGAAAAAWLVSIALGAEPPAAAVQAQGTAPPAGLFATSEQCMACHNGLIAPDGRDVSIGVAWRATIMANSGRDPYWQASVRRETIDHPGQAEAIQDECAVCHIPMAHTAARAAGRLARTFEHLPVNPSRGEEAALAADGVSCTTCHQIRPDNFGSRASFNGGFVIDTTLPPEQRPLYGPFEVHPGLQTVMHSVTGFRPEQSEHMRQSELCATCHTLYTKALGPDGQVVGELPEQVPFLEWQHSRYGGERSCQSCHMPAMPDGSPIASVLGEGRDGAAQHTFVGGNAFMLRLLNRFRDELGVTAEVAEMEASAAATERHLATATAGVAIDNVRAAGGRVAFSVAVRNLAGHKFPTAYPSRRAWLHVRLLDANGTTVWESGAPGADGAIAGNDNDADPARFEPHYTRITANDQVQIYEPILQAADGTVTTGLLSAVTYRKDNRLLPEGFDKASASADIAVHGEAAADPDFVAGGDRLEYDVPVASGEAAVTIRVDLLFQPIGFRWAKNLSPYDADETRRFTRYVEGMGGVGTATVAHTSLNIQ